MTRVRIFTTLVAILTFVLLATGCPRGGGGSSGAEIINSLKTLTGQADQAVGRIPHSADSSELSALRGRLDENLARVPDNLSSEEMAAREAAEAARDTLEIAISQGQRQEGIPQTAAILADGSRPSAVSPNDTAWVELRESLRRNGEDCIKQFACEQSWNALAPEKKQELKPPTTFWFVDVPEENLQRYIDIVHRDWKLTAVGRYVSWGQYSKDLSEKVTEFAAQSQLAAPAQAYIYYARYCLTPPIP
jgi:hypothetical protein